MILISSYSFEEIEKTCDRVGIIRQGELVVTENIHDLKQKRRKTYIVTFDSPATAEAFALNKCYNEIILNGKLAKVSVLGNVTQLVNVLINS